jgi:diphthine-ammonia ligase
VSIKTAVLWTGGKDSALALYEAQQSGYDISLLVTFSPPGTRFRAHPISLMDQQAQAMGIAHRVINIEEPMRDNYTAALGQLAERDGIAVVVTGDISEVDGKSNWIRECSQGLALDVQTPLWHRDREELLDKLISVGFKTLFTCVKAPWFTGEWVGRELDRAAVQAMRELRVTTGLDLSGEQGEYHTMVTDGPPFRRRVDIPAYGVNTGNGLAYLDFGNVSASGSVPEPGSVVNRDPGTTG